MTSTTTAPRSERQPASEPRSPADLFRYHFGMVKFMIERGRNELAISHYVQQRDAEAQIVPL